MGRSNGTWWGLGALGVLVSLGCGGLPLDGEGPQPGDVVEGVVERAPVEPGQARNILLIVADDLGTDKVGAYQEHPSPPATPSLDRLAAEGVLFENAYGYGTGAATRAALLTGRYGRRYGLGGPLRSDVDYELPLSEMLLPEMLTLAPEPWASAALGKWGLATDASPSGVGHPTEQGFGSFAGTLDSLDRYEGFEKVVDGEVEKVKGYATVDTTDDAIERLNRLQSPWLLYVAFHAPHEPAHVPPADVLGREVPRDATEAERIDAAIEVLDKEVGRLLEAMSPRQREETLVVFLGDNGTASPAVRPPLDSTHAKNSLFEGGTNIPLLVRGPGVERGKRTKALAHVIDLVPTLAASTGVDLDRLANPVDGTSLWPALGAPDGPGSRDFVYTEKFRPTGEGPYDIDWRSVRNDRYKLLDVGGSKPQFFELEGRFDDGMALRPAQLTPDEQAAYEALAEELDRMRAELP